MSKQRQLKLNCDMGESFAIWKLGADKQVMPYINQANIACGFHAGDPDVMSETIALAKAAGVEVGAHPGYQDKEGFGRRAMVYSTAQITHLVSYQIGALKSICQLYDCRLSYVKPHGALYNCMMQDIQVFSAIVKAVAASSEHTKPLSLMILARPDLSEYQAIAKQYQVPLIFEAFADRSYDEQGLLVARSKENAVLKDPQAIIEQVTLLKEQQGVVTQSDKFIALQVDTICVHGDNQAAIDLIAQLQRVISQ